MTATAERAQVRYKLSTPQRAVFKSTARFRVLVAGRRFGKSYLACILLLTAAVGGRDRICWYVAPTYRQGKEILWKQLRRIIPEGYIAAVNETELSIVLINGSVIAIRGADNPDSLRGVGLFFLVLDEFADLKAETWFEVLRPALADNQGSALFVGTPKGYNWAYSLFLAAQAATDGSWAAWAFTTLDGGNVPQEEVDAARSTMDSRIFRQEFEASFESLFGRVYDQFSRAFRPLGNVDASVTDAGASEILVGMDFNINPMSVVIGVRAADELHVVDALEILTSNTREAATEIRRRYPTARIIVCPDPSGKARKTSASGETDFTILTRAGLAVDAPNAAPRVEDRINATQALLCDAKDRRRLRVHPRAAALIRALDGLTYKDGTRLPDKTGGLDHITDALGYLVWQRFNLLVAAPSITLSTYDS